jgi:hypothetical protein
VRALLLIVLSTWCLAPCLQAQVTGFPAAFEPGDVMTGERWGAGLRAQLTRPPTPQPAQLRVELTAEGETPFEPMKPIQFAVRAEPWRQDLEYRYSFGDGPPTGWLRDSRFPHTYNSPGSYQVFVEVRPTRGPTAASDSVKSNALTVQVLRKEESIPAHPSTGSNRVPVRVVAQPGPPKPGAPKPEQSPVARLEIYPPEAQTGEPVRLRAFVEPETEGLEFTFEFGDGLESPRQAEPAAEHRYSNPGAYEVLVRAHKGDRIVAESRPVRITVAPRAEHRLLLEADTRTPQVGGRVRFTWRVEPPLEGVLYLVEFGDSESAWVSQPLAEHAYARPGEHRVLIRARIGGGEVQSNDVIVAVRTADQGPPYVFIAAVLAAAGAMVGVWRIIVRFRRRKSTRADDGAPTETSVVVRPHHDPGTQEVEPSAPDSESSEVRLLPVPDRGEQAMEQGYIIRKKGGGSHE